MTIVYDFLATSRNRLRAGPNAKTKDDRTEEDPTFKLYYRGQMIGLIRKIILAACDPNHDCTGDTKRETNLKNEMEIVRRMIFPWPDLTMFLTSRESTCLTARKNAGRDV